MPNEVVYPTVEHRLAAEAITDFFSGDTATESVILIGSCARGRAVPDSCLDLLILVRPDALAVVKEELQRRWSDFCETAGVFKKLARVGKYSHVDLDFVNGRFSPRPRGWTSGPDEFELEIGNALVYSAVLWVRGDYLESLRRRWLPYYDESLREERLAMARRYCLNNLDHIPFYVERGLHFQAFNRLYDAFREFLQALFISRRTYPIAYDKWIREQVEEILSLPDLYRCLPKLFEIARFESPALTRKGAELRELVDAYL